MQHWRLPNRAHMQRGHPPTGIAVRGRVCPKTTSARRERARNRAHMQRRRPPNKVYVQRGRPSHMLRMQREPTPGMESLNTLPSPTGVGADSPPPRPGRTPRVPKHNCLCHPFRYGPHEPASARLRGTARHREAAAGNNGHPRKDRAGTGRDSPSAAGRRRAGDA